MERDLPQPPPLPLPDGEDERPPERRHSDPAYSVLLVTCFATAGASFVAAAMPFAWTCAAPIAAFSLIACIIVGVNHGFTTRIIACAVLAGLMIAGGLARADKVNDELRSLGRELGRP